MIKTKWNFLKCLGSFSFKSVLYACAWRSYTYASNMAKPNRLLKHVWLLPSVYVWVCVCVCVWSRGELASCLGRDTNSHSHTYFPHALTHTSHSRHALSLSLSPTPTWIVFFSCESSPIARPCYLFLRKKSKKFETCRKISLLQRKQILKEVKLFFS